MCGGLRYDQGTAVKTSLHFNKPSSKMDLYLELGNQRYDMVGRCYLHRPADCQPKRPPVPYSAATLELKWRSAKDTLNGQNFQL